MARARVLVVDDELALRIAMVRVLQDLAEVSSAADVASALSLPRAFDLVVSDLSMPNANGLELAKRLRADGYMGPFIVTSGALDPELATAAKDGLIQGVLTKPWSIADLRTLVARYVAAPA